MNGQLKIRALAMIGIAALGLALSAAAAFDLNWRTIDGGGGAMTGGDWSLNATTGQPDAGVMAGGSFTLNGGFWPAISVGDSEPACPGDINGDGKTDHSDLALMLAAWGAAPGDPNWNPAADLNGDGKIGHGDLATLLGDWGCGL